METDDIKTEQHSLLILTDSPSPFAVIFTREYNFFACWYFHTCHNFNATSSDVLHRRLNDAYEKYKVTINNSSTHQGSDQRTNVENNKNYKDTEHNFPPVPRYVKRKRRLEAVIDAFIQMKETAELQKQHMEWLEEIEERSVHALPELYCKKPKATLESVMIMCSKSRLFIRCVLENLRNRDCENASYERKENDKYKHVNEEFVQRYIPYYLRLQNCRKPRVLKPCTCNNLSLDLPPLHDSQ